LAQAQKALEVTLGGSGELREIEYALAHALTVGVSDEVLKEAKAEIGKIVAGEELKEARRGSSRPGLERCVRNARLHGVDSEETGAAEVTRVASGMESNYSTYVHIW